MKNQNRFLYIAMVSALALSPLSSSLNSLRFGNDQNYKRNSHVIYRDTDNDDIDKASPGDAEEEEVIPVYDSLEDAGAYVRQEMKNRNEVITLGITFRVSGFPSKLFDEAVKHTGVPDEGDYLRWLHNTYSVKADDIYWKNGIQYYRFRFTYYTTKEEEDELDKYLDDYMASLPLESMSDYEKVRAIYYFICQHVRYSFNNSGETPTERLKYRSAYQALINGTAVCQGYASLFYNMALRAGVDARFIRGDVYDESTGTNLGHGWNIVKLDGSYYYLDSTWDSVYNHPFNYSYFLRGEENFKDHVISSTFVDMFSNYDISEKDYSDSHVVDDSDFTPEYIYDDSIKWSYNSVGILTITGTGEIKDYPLGTKRPWEDLPVKSVVIGDGITKIGNNAFNNLSELESISLPSDSLTEIGENAFFRCPKLTSVYIPTSVTTIGSEALGYVESSSTGKAVPVKNFVITCGNSTAAESYAVSNSFECLRPINNLQMPSPIVERTSSGVKLSWSNVQNATSYEIERICTDDNNPEENAVSFSTDTNKFSDDTVAAGKTYKYKVRSVFGNLYSDWSMDQPEITVLTAPVPRVSSKTSSYVELTWENTAGATSYSVSSKRNGSPKWTDNLSIVAKPASGNTVKTTIYMPFGKGNLYHFTVYAKNDSSVSPMGQPIDVFIPFSGPANLTSAFNNGSIDLRWTPVEGADGYEVFASINGSYYNSIDHVSNTEYKFDNLALGTDYRFKIRAYKEIDGTKYYGDYSSDTGYKYTIATPSGFSAVAQSTSKITLKWNAVPDAAYYELYRATSTTSTNWTKIGVYSTNTANNSNLTANKTFYYKVRGYKTVNGNKVYSDYSSIVSAKTKAVPQVTGLKITGGTYNSVNIKWNSVPGATSYHVYKGLKNSSGQITWTKHGVYTKTSCALKNLVTGNTYYFKVQAAIKENNTVNYGSYSTSVNRLLKFAKPVIISAEGVNSSSIQLNWKTVNGAVYYELYRSTKKTGGTWTKIGIYNRTTVTNKSLKSKTTYYYKVRAYKSINGTKVYSDFCAPEGATTK
ncbi:leucine-rich repeat protein [Eubacterium sp.]|uniref:fibronectin type III domain-containing protein n=1 Tax=Eubacterium sp. TaxID=142586 RepID=UPI002589FBD0|nr:leucine-rich repeat protein [Eubacterium sp.]MCR5368610.1 leucine-rich repeat protein [Eubacterium sp.]